MEELRSLENQYMQARHTQIYVANRKVANRKAAH